jgi:anti-sigma factor RsiW
MADGAADTGPQCPQTTLTAAYLDGELDATASEEFERHAKTCPACSASLLEQRRLLCLLGTAFDESFGKNVALPRDFTRRVRARAHADMSGLRHARERRLALKICVALAAAAFALLGFAAFDAVVAPVVDAARAGVGALGVAGRAAADAGAGAGVVARAFGLRLGDSPLALVPWAVVFVALVLLLRLVVAYHRTGRRAGD